MPDTISANICSEVVEMIFKIAVIAGKIALGIFGAGVFLGAGFF